ncbi:hypothetical protein TSOC_010509 [Tetrabaena socialis]|uniref:Uncharacterized protein n=1 Tax=Tetrabaena socialis TaxID=47790 RepID=A0A2J7ZT23_9CHLO|nr:hypothetical protein TSOC_010509 [Tetrabaena socialis]|eukprot:PNH03421.1 hypothetical protein TSOC_010509 [Tetrabaena socialis]
MARYCTSAGRRRFLLCKLDGGIADAAAAVIIAATAAALEQPVSAATSCGLVDTTSASCRFINMAPAREGLRVSALLSSRLPLAAVKSSSAEANTLASSGLPAMMPATALLVMMAVASSGLEASAWGSDPRADPPALQPGPAVTHRQVIASVSSGTAATACASACPDAASALGSSGIATTTSANPGWYGSSAASSVEYDTGEDGGGGGGVAAARERGGQGRGGEGEEGHRGGLSVDPANAAARSGWFSSTPRRPEDEASRLDSASPTHPRPPPPLVSAPSAMAAASRGCIASSLLLHDDELEAAVSGGGSRRVPQAIAAAVARTVAAAAARTVAAAVDRTIAAPVAFTGRGGGNGGGGGAHKGVAFRQQQPTANPRRRRAVSAPLRRAGPPATI